MIVQIDVLNAQGQHAFYIEGDKLFGGIDYQQCINSTTDYAPGTVATAQLVFTTSEGSLGKGDTIIANYKYNESDLYIALGYFIVSEVENTGQRLHRYKMTCYDKNSKFNRVVDDYITSIWPTTSSTNTVTLQTFYRGLCTFCGVNYASLIFPHRDYVIHNNFTSTNLTGTQLLKWIAEITHGYFYSVPDTGNIRLNYNLYAGTGSAVTLTGHEYNKKTVSSYTTWHINRVFIGQSEDDVGVSYPDSSDTSCLKIIGNQLLVWANDTEREIVRGIAQEIYTYSANIYYKPTTVELYQDQGVNAGGWIKIGNDYIPVYSKKITKSGTTFECTGNMKCDPSINKNAELNALRGKYTEIKNEVGDLSITVGDHAEELETAVHLKPDGVHIADKDGSLITLSGNGIDASTINCGDLNMTGRIAWGDLNANTQAYISEEKVPDYIKSTYIDFSTVQAPAIKGTNISLCGGSFDVMDLAGLVSYGHMGFGTGYDAGQVNDYGVLISADDSTVTTNDSYVIITSRGILLNTANCSITLNSTGGTYTDGTGSWKLGPARFG